MGKASMKQYFRSLANKATRRRKEHWAKDGSQEQEVERGIVRMNEALLPCRERERERERERGKEGGRERGREEGRKPKITNGSRWQTKAFTLTYQHYLILV